MNEEPCDELYCSLFITTMDTLPFNWVNCKTLGFIDAMDDWGFQGTIQMCHVNLCFIKFWANPV